MLLTTEVHRPIRAASPLTVRSSELKRTTVPVRRWDGPLLQFWLYVWCGESLFRQVNPVFAMWLPGHFWLGITVVNYCLVLKVASRHRMYKTVGAPGFMSKLRWFTRAADLQVYGTKQIVRSPPPLGGWWTEGGSVCLIVWVSRPAIKIIGPNYWCVHVGTHQLATKRIWISLLVGDVSAG